jgi:hypothetical protein
LRSRIHWQKSGFRSSAIAQQSIETSMPKLSSMRAMRQMPTRLPYSMWLSVPMSRISGGTV